MDRRCCWFTVDSATTRTGRPSYPTWSRTSPSTRWIAGGVAPAATGPTTPPQREFEDVAAVIDAVAADSGSRTDVYGFSSGATFALGAAALTQNVRRLALYEPGITAAAVVVTPELHARLDALLTAGDGDGLVETFFREAFGLGDDDIATMRAQPSWAAYVAAAPTLPRELRATPEQLFDASRAAKMNVPTLLLEGNEPLKNVLADVRTAADLRLVADTVPGARIAVLEGQAHAANVLAPELVAEHLLAFFGEPT